MKFILLSSFIILLSLRAQAQNTNIELCDKILEIYRENHKKEIKENYWSSWVHPNAKQIENVKVSLNFIASRPENGIIVCRSGIISRLLDPYLKKDEVAIVNLSDYSIYIYVGSQGYGQKPNSFSKNYEKSSFTRSKIHLLYQEKLASNLQAREPASRLDYNEMTKTRSIYIITNDFFDRSKSVKTNIYRSY